MKSIKVYKSGLHLGEEKIIKGNHCSGMIYFSGCHLACNFCYTPEISFANTGTEFSSDTISGLFEDLIRLGAKNINLISPFHVWGVIKDPLIALKKQYPHLPIILKSSGFESVCWIDEIASIASMWIPDYKVFSPEAAKAVRLPQQYSDGVAAAVSRALRTWPDPQLSEGKMTRGILVRHLIMPGFLDDSLEVVRSLGKIGYRSYVNFMTYFVDPKTKQVHNANPAELSLLVNQACALGMQPLINGRALQKEQLLWAM